MNQHTRRCGAAGQQGERPMSYYATSDYDDGRIKHGAKIVEFLTEEAARAWLLEPYGSEWDVKSAKIGASSDFGDCWFKSSTSPETLPKSAYAPFTYAQLRIFGPGAHSGSREWWVEPIPAVLVVSEIHEIDSD